MNTERSTWRDGKTAPRDGRRILAQAYRVPGHMGPSILIEATWDRDYDGFLGRLYDGVTAPDELPLVHVNIIRWLPLPLKETGPKLPPPFDPAPTPHEHKDREAKTAEVSKIAGAMVELIDTLRPTIEEVRGALAQQATSWGLPSIAKAWDRVSASRSGLDRLLELLDDLGL